MPSLPFTYIPSSPSLKTLLSVASMLNHKDPVSVDIIAKSAKVSDGTAHNVIHDLIMFGVATGTARELRLDERVSSGEHRQVLLRLRHVLRRHALVLNLARREKSDAITTDTIIDTLKATNRAAQHGARTWRLYAERIARWLHAAGLLGAADGAWRVVDRGDVHLPKSRRGKVSRFLGEAPPETTIEAAAWLELKPRSSDDVHTSGFRNAVAVLRQLDIAIVDENAQQRVRRRDPSKGWEQVVWEAARRDPYLLRGVEAMNTDSTISVDDLARIVGGEQSKGWTESSLTRAGNGIRRWVAWLRANGGPDDSPASTKAIPRFRRRKRRRGPETRSLFDGPEDVVG